MTMARGDRVNWRTGATPKGRGAQGGGGTTPLLLSPLHLLLLVAGVSRTAAMAASGDEEEVTAAGTKDFRDVPYESLLHSMDQFAETGISHYSEILFDVKRHQLIVGARDSLFR